MTDLAQAKIREVLRPGELAVDATVGNGLDTFFLADTVGPQGHVIGFDIQQTALERTTIILGEAGLLTRVKLLRCGHESMTQELPALWQGRIKAVMFNLGYLPRGNKAIITRPETTIPAVNAAAALLCSGGRITLVLYQGHNGGREETQQLKDWAQKLPSIDYEVELTLPESFVDDAPELLVISKR
ncbi:MAG: class I SAM-dependent methyltransferase [Verrucomicrobiota bacterium]